MSKENVVSFFMLLRQEYYLQKEFHVRNLSELLFHASNLGYHFELEHLTELIAKMELTIIQEKLQEEFGPDSSLWPKMWGKYRLEYVLEHLFDEFSEEEIKALITESEESL
ncbi:MAG: hypothetical protein AB4060_05010 [Crocosphaera sp.]